MKGENPDIVMVERDTYDAMVAAYTRTKAERLRNKEIAEDLENDLELLQHEMEALCSKVTELNTSITGLSDEVNKKITDEGLKESMKELLDGVSFSVLDMQDNTHKLLNEIRRTKVVLKPFKDFKG